MTSDDITPEHPLPPSARLRYDVLGVQHAAELFEPLSDSALYTYQPADPPASLDWLVQRFQTLSRGHSADHGEQWCNWLMRDSKSGAPVGMLQATVTPDHSAYIAYIVFTRYQRMGLAQEAVVWMLDQLQAVHGCTQATAEVDTRNTGSNRLLQKLGFETTGMKPDADYFKGASSDEYQYRRELARGA
jgi:ribosomal-protein-alanine N-acetyltransferase